MIRYSPKKAAQTDIDAFVKRAANHVVPRPCQSI